MKISLTPEIRRFVEEQVKSGRYPTANDLIQSPISRLQTSDQLSEEDIDDLPDEAAIGVREADAGKFVDFTAETIIVEGKRILRR